MPPNKKRPGVVSEPAASTYIANTPVLEIGAGAFKDKCLQLLDQVRGRAVEVLVTKHGEPVARLVAPVQTLPSAFGFLRGTVSETGDIVAPDFDAWEQAD
jgi:prevent-host-death family protein